MTEDVAYAEGLRFAGGALYFSDMIRGRVVRVDGSGATTTVADGVPGASGLGFDGAGNLYVVARGEDRLYRVDGSGRRTVAADLGAAGCHLANDLVSDESGVLYVGCLGRAYTSGDELRQWGTDAPGKLFAVDVGDPAVPVVEVAGGLACPNGMVVSPDRSTLVVAETYRGALTAFDRAPDGALTNRRVAVRFERGQPDGLALDRDGGIWAGLPYAEEFVRVDRRGTVTDRVPVDGEWAVGCALGGPDRSTLYLAVATTTMADFQAGRSTGRILAVPVEIPGAGWP